MDSTRSSPRVVGHSMVLLSCSQMHRSYAPPAQALALTITLRVWCGLHHLHGTHLRVPEMWYPSTGHLVMTKVMVTSTMRHLVMTMVMVMVHSCSYTTLCVLDARGAPYSWTSS